MIFRVFGLRIRIRCDDPLMLLVWSILFKEWGVFQRGMGSILGGSNRDR